MSNFYDMWFQGFIKSKMNEKLTNKSLSKKNQIALSINHIHKRLFINLLFLISFASKH